MCSFASDDTLQAILHKLYFNGFGRVSKMVEGSKKVCYQNVFLGHTGRDDEDGLA